ncbi:MAG: hypothetical protein HY815_15960 [Candidatus Riflebacteria bacterium]|nr:hypothetical protein [Candidatus Riflebacteria bacterium]
MSDGGERQFCLTTLESGLEVGPVPLGQLVKYAVAHRGIENDGHRDIETSRLAELLELGPSTGDLDWCFSAAS